MHTLRFSIQIYSLTLDPKTQNVAYLAPLSTAIQSISASRMVFNLREASEGKVTSTSGLSAIRTHVTHHTVSDGGTPAHKLSAFSFARSNLATPHLSDPIDAEEKAETHELGEKLEVIDLNGHRSYR